MQKWLQYRASCKKQRRPPLLFSSSNAPSASSLNHTVSPPSFLFNLVSFQMIHHDLNPLMNLSRRCNADFYWLRGNVFPCTGLPLLVMYQHEHCSTLENIKYIYYHKWHNNEFSCILISILMFLASSLQWVRKIWTSLYIKGIIHYACNHYNL